jgi:hypothetical protein
MLLLRYHTNYMQNSMPPPTATEETNPLFTKEGTAGAATGLGAGVLAYFGFAKLREHSGIIKELLKKTDATSIEEARKIARETIDTTKKAIEDLGHAATHWNRDYREIVNVEMTARQYLVDIEKALKVGVVEGCIVVGVAVGTGLLVYQRLHRDFKSPTTQIDGASAEAQERTVSQETQQHTV